MSTSTDSPALNRIRGIYSVWGRHPRLYDAQDWLTFLGRHQTIRRCAVNALGLERGASVLEVGCGTGRNFPYLREAIGARGQLVGFDFSREMLRAAERLSTRRGWTNVRLVRGDAAELDVGSDPFDGVLSILAMSAIPDYVGALTRCHEVLRSGRVLSICDAQPFRGALQVLNPAARALYGPLAAWAPDRPIVDEMRRIFGNVEVRYFNSGSFFVATSRK